MKFDKTLTILNTVLFGVMFVLFCAGKFVPSNLLVGFLLFHVSLNSGLHFLELKHKEEFDNILKKELEKLDGK